MKAAARREGKLVMITANSGARAFVPPIREVFGEQFGIDVTLTGGSGGAHFSRISAERAGGRYEVDIAIQSRANMGERMAPAGFLTPIQDQLFHPDAIDTSNWWLDRLWWREPDGVEPKYSLAYSIKANSSPLTPSYNTDLVTEADIAEINSIWDFLDDKWKSKIIALSPLESGGSGSIGHIYGHAELGPEWIERFFSKELDVTFTGDIRQIVDSIALGGHAISFFHSSAGRELEALRAEGLPVAEWSKNLKEGGRLSGNSSWHWIGMMDRAPHPNAAKLFLNWWLTQDGQTAYNTRSATPVPPSLREDVPVGISEPTEQRKPGAVYEMSGLDTNLPDFEAEAKAFTQRLFLERSQ